VHAPVQHDGKISRPVSFHRDYCDVPSARQPVRRRRMVRRATWEKVSHGLVPAANRFNRLHRRDQVEERFVRCHRWTEITVLEPRSPMSE